VQLFAAMPVFFGQYAHINALSPCIMLTAEIVYNIVCNPVYPLFTRWIVTAFELLPKNILIAVRGQPNQGESLVTVFFAVNGTLMRGLELNANLVAAGGEFVREAVTVAAYRLWTIDDRHPAMLRVRSGGANIHLEIWRMPLATLGLVLLQEPPGLSIGKIALADGSEVLGVLGEPYLCEGQSEITRWGGWRQYMASKEGVLSNGTHP
jgi:hypothetical protein